MPGTELEKLLTKLLQEQRLLSQRLGALSRAIETLKVLIDDPLPLNLVDEASFAELVSVTQASPLTPAEIVEECRKILIEGRRPMKRGALVKEIEARGKKIPGQDKNKNLGTVLWRHQDQFIHLPKLGYWLRNEKLAGVWDPSEDI